MSSPTDIAAMQRVTVKLSDVIDGIDMATDESSCYLVLYTGRVKFIDEDTLCTLRMGDDEQDLPEWQRPIVAIARLIEADENQQRFLPLPDRFEIHEWQMMADFAAGVEDEAIRSELTNACRGSGAFGRFKDAVHRLGVEQDWFAHRDQCYRQCAIDWCEANDIPWQ